MPSSLVMSGQLGEMHDLPARLVADYLGSEGYAVRYLSANEPTEGLRDALAEESPDLLALSVTMSFNVTGPMLRTEPDEPGAQNSASSPRNDLPDFDHDDVADPQ